MIWLATSLAARLLCAPPGVDSQVFQLADILDRQLDPISPWRDLCVGEEDPLITVRGNLPTFVYRVRGQYEVLDSIGVCQQFSLAVIQVHEDRLIAVNLMPASIDYTEILVNLDQYAGRLDFQMLGRPRVLRAQA